MSAEELGRLEQICFGGSGWSHPQLVGALTRPGAVCVVDPDRGYVLGECVLDEVELHRIGVVPSQRRTGLGRDLFDRFVHAAVSLGAKRLFLEVRADNHAARALYASVGLGTLGERPRYYRDGCAAVLLGMDLTPGSPA